MVREAAGERAQLGVKAESLEATVKELSAELQELKHRSSKAADAAASQIESLTGRLAQAQASAAEWKGEAEALRKECEGLKVERATAEGLLNSAADSRGALEREQEKALDANASLGRQLEAARERISELQAEIQELELLTSGSMQEARQAWALEKSALTKRHVEHVRSLEAKHAKVRFAAPAAAALKPMLVSRTHACDAIHCVQVNGCWCVCACVGCMEEEERAPALPPMSARSGHSAWSKPAV